MADRIPSDNETVESIRTRLSQVGRTAQPELALPEELDCPADTVIRLALDGTFYHAQVESDLRGNSILRRATTTARLARSGEGENHLATWAERNGVESGDALLVDVLTEGYAYGLREPGDRIVYEPPGEPSDSLDNLARTLEDA